MELMDHQLEAIEQLDSGKILWGGVGSGKSAAVLGYYVKKETPRDVIVITTAKKRDSLDWEREAAKFGIGTEKDGTLHGVLVVDSWNNVHKYTDVEGAFFVFDEQRVVGRGLWVKSFLKIAKTNNWVLLSATPGDTWMDYIPVFIANGFFRSRAQFHLEHVLYEPFHRYPQIRGYLNETKLELLRNHVLVEMPYFGDSKRILNYMPVDYDRAAYRRARTTRWHPYEDRPIKDAAELYRVQKRIVNSDPSRLEFIRGLMKIHPRLVIFYNFDYELDILRQLADEIEVFEWNGHRKHPVPEGDRWVYLVQYVAGAEAWNCTSTNAMVLYSMTGSYKNHVQAQGRIDRMDTPYDVLYYYILVSHSPHDLANKLSLREKKDFNERKFIREQGKFEDWEEEPLETCQI